MVTTKDGKDGSAMKFHEVANLLSLMDPAALEDLAADIKARGQRDPIITFNGSIIDGRNRFLACQKAGVKPVFKEWDEKGGTIVEFVDSKNVKRRQLTPTQLAVWAQGALEYEEKEAKKRLATNTVGRKSQPRVIVPQADNGKATDQVAKKVGVSGSYVSRVKAIKEDAPDLLPLMRDGKATVPQAKAVAALPEPERKAIIALVDKGKTISQAKAAVVKPEDPEPAAKWDFTEVLMRIREFVKKELKKTPEQEVYLIAHTLRSIATELVGKEQPNEHNA